MTFTAKAHELSHRYSLVATGGASSRFQRVEDTVARYSRNIARRYGGELGRRGYTYDTDRNKRASRSVYMGLNAG